MKMICTPISYRKRIILSAISMAILILGYSWMSHIQHSKNSTDTTIPNFAQLVHGFHKIVTPNSSGDIPIIRDAKATSFRFTLGMIIGSAVAIMVGMVIGCFESFAAMSRWALILLSNAVPTAMMAIYFFLFGTGEELFVAIVALGIFSPIALGIYDSIKKDVPDELIFTTYTLGASNFEAAYEAVFKQIFPRIILLIQAQIGPALVYLIAVEWIMSDRGFGYHLRIQLRLLNMSQVYEYILILAGAGFFLNWGFTTFRRKIAPWFGE